MIDNEVRAAADKVLELCRAAGLRLATVESCTGGLVSAALTDIAGSSDVVDRGYVTYANAAKHEMVGVPEALLIAHGAVSEPVARAMAEGGLEASGTDIVVAITGIAGPGGGSPEKPVGLVHFALARRGATTIHRERRFGERTRPDIRRLALIEALNLLAEGAGARVSA